MIAAMTLDRTIPRSDPSPAQLFSMDGRVALVTGASSGLGARFAQVLDHAGATVVAVARRLDRLQALEADGQHIHGLACDVGDRAQVTALIDAVVRDHGQIDVVVNNAGTSDTAPALKQDEDEFEQVLGINLVAPYRISTHAAKAMVAAGRPGAIVNIASILGLRGSAIATQTGYAASKGGVESLTRSLAAQWARYGIRVNALAPGWFETEMTADMFASEQATKWVAQRTPLGRQGREGELDGALLLLASEAGSFITGETIVVDGGWTAV
jgi:NAD(P)-dependent dehydrogenase (short-subunit alcohol dehydrogenase family)